MSIRQITQVSAVPTNVSTETAIAVSPNITLPLAGNTAKVSGVLNITAGAGTTAIVLKVRQGNGVAGAQVQGNMTHTLAAAASANVPYDVQDSSGAYAADGGIPYTVTVTQTGGTGAGTVNQGTINAESN
jgi:hypothetical protein